MVAADVPNSLEIRYKFNSDILIQLPVRTGHILLPPPVIIATFAVMVNLCVHLPETTFASHLA